MAAKSYAEALDRVYSELKHHQAWSFVPNSSDIDRFLDEFAEPGARDSLPPLAIETSPLARPRALHLLFDKARRYCPREPDKAARLLELARMLFTDLGSKQRNSSIWLDLQARYSSIKGNLLRIQGLFYEAELSFREAESLAALGTGDLEIAAEVLTLHASLHLDCTQFVPARRSLQLAAGIFRSLGRRDEVGRIWMKLASLENLAGRHRRALALFRDAIKHLEGSDDPVLSGKVLASNYAFYLCEAGEVEQALDLIASATASQISDPKQRCLAFWREGLIFHRAGQSHRAVSRFTAASTGFCALEDAHNYALCSLDLAAVLAERGDNHQVKRIALETMEIFHSLAVPQDAWTAWLLFARAAREDALSVTLVREVRGLLSSRRAWVCRATIS